MLLKFVLSRERRSDQCILLEDQSFAVVWSFECNMKLSVGLVLGQLLDQSHPDESYVVAVTGIGSCVHIAFCIVYSWCYIHMCNSN